MICIYPAGEQENFYRDLKEYLKAWWRISPHETGMADNIGYLAVMEYDQVR